MKNQQFNLKKRINHYVEVDRLLPHFRKDYSKGWLDKKNLRRDPWIQFTVWLEDALRARVPCANAMALATVSSRNKPSVRIVLLKGFDRRGFVFFSPYKSPKARDIAGTGDVSVAIHWPQLERQIRISGKAVKISRAESGKYFNSRPEGAQLAAWISPQSQVIGSRKKLDLEFEKVKGRFLGKKIPLPPFWGGYRLAPKEFEFWQGRGNRLNDRFRFLRRAKNKWKVDRLTP